METKNSTQFVLDKTSVNSAKQKCGVFYLLNCYGIQRLDERHSPSGLVCCFNLAERLLTL